MIPRESAHRLIDQLFEIRAVQVKLIPNEANQHFQKAKKEGLLGIQDLLSHLIQRMDDGQEMKSEQELQVKKIKVEE
jgi:hypothetical protein